MRALQEIEQLLTTLTRAEKAQVLQWVVRDLGEAFPGIESTPEVCGGEPCIIRTRLPVWVLVQAQRLGTSEADLLRSYPTLWAEALTNTWAYARAHQEEIEQQILANETARPMATCFWPLSRTCLPPYSPDLSPIEPCWSKLKAYLGKAQARSQNEFRSITRGGHAQDRYVGR